MRALVLGLALAAGALCLALVRPAPGEVIAVKISDLVFSPRR
jgi:hypothetical protein